MSESNNKSKGVVKWFNDAKGFGFIEHTSGKDVFVHYSVIETDGFKTLKDGEEVVYEMKEGPKGFHAVKVQRTQPLKSEVKVEGSSDSQSDDSDSQEEQSQDAAESAVTETETSATERTAN